MPELALQVCYAVLATVAASVAIVTYSAHLYERCKRPAFLGNKPFTCVYCMTVWVGAVVSTVVFGDKGIVMWPIVHILAWIVYQKAM